MVEVVSCLEKDGRAVFNDLRWGVYVVIEAPGEYQKECFKQYGLKTDSTGWYAAQYKPYHLIGLELGISIASIMVREEPTSLRHGQEMLSQQRNVILKLARSWMGRAASWCMVSS